MTLQDWSVPPRWRRACAPLALAAAVALGPVAHAAAGGDVAALPQDLTELSLDELLAIEVTSVSKRAQKVSESPAAIAVLTGDEIRRMGVRSIVEALRRVPGLQVARTSTNSYAVYSRGLAGDKLEVLLDGRSVYTPLTSTVFWDVLDTYLPDIDRIEIIRGPGATLYGANAVNGVINIITRNSAETTGTEILAGTGTEERAFGGVSTGSKITESGYIRLYAKAFERDNSVLPDGQPAFDGTRQSHAGFRSDWTPAPGHTFQIGGGLYDAVQNSKAVTSNDRVEGDRSGGSLQASWKLDLENDGSIQLGGYYDHYRLFIPEVFQEARDTFQVEFEHGIPMGSQHVIWGLGYRNSRDETGGPPLAIILSPEARTIEVASAFIQDQIRLAEGLELTLGSKFEHNDFTGFEIQPGVRLGWNAGSGVYTWASVARAVRTPNRLDSDAAIFCSQGLVTIGACSQAQLNTALRIGNPDLESEKLIAYEWGLRYALGDHLAFDLATFFNDYSELRSTEAQPAPFGSFENKLEGESFGAELGVSWLPWSWLELRPFYGFLELDLRARPDSTDPDTAMELEGNSAEQMAGLRFNVGPFAGVNTTGLVRFIDELPNQEVPAYTELNLRIAWRVASGFELALVGENLLDAQHAEFGLPASRTELERSGLLEVHWVWQ